MSAPSAAPAAAGTPWSDAPSRWGVLRTCSAFLVRDLTLLRRNQASLISMLVVPGLFMGCLYAVFGYASDKVGLDYAGFLFAGTLLQAAIYTAGASAMVVAVDLQSGLIDRIRIYPRSLAGFIAGRICTDAIRMICSCVPLVLVGRWCGMEPSTGEAAHACAWGLLVAVVLSVLANGMVLVSAQPVELAGFIQTVETLLLLFSTAFIPATALIATLKTVVTHMPFSPIAELFRSEMGAAVTNAVRAEALTWTTGVFLLGLGLAARGFGQRGKRGR